MINVAIGLLAFCGTTNALRALLPGPGDVVSTPKFEYFAEHAEEYDAVYLGSSRVYRHFIPAIFDGRLKELGQPLRSFNFGAPGAGAYEVDNLLKRILALDNARLSYVFIEPTSWVPRIFEHNRETARTVDWHTFVGTRKALQATWNLRATLSERMDLAEMHIRLCGWWFSNLGQGRRLIRKFSALPANPLEFGQKQGYRSLEEEESPAFALRREYLSENPAKLKLKLARLSSNTSFLNSRAGRYVDLVAEQVDSVRAIGAVPVYVIPPGTVATPEAYGLYSAGALDILFAFNVPTRFPSFYRLDLFFDNNHLSHGGAQEFSRQFADSIAEWLAGKNPGALVGAND